jgi:hypothetical protein
MHGTATESNFESFASQNEHLSYLHSSAVVTSFGGTDRDKKAGVRILWLTYKGNYELLVNIGKEVCAINWELNSQLIDYPDINHHKHASVLNRIYLLTN